MCKRVMPVCLLVVLALTSSAIPGTAHAMPGHRVSCSFIKAIQSNLSQLSKVVKDAPHLSPRQAKQRTDVIRLHETTLEFGNTRQVVPRSLDQSIIGALSAVQGAAMSRAKHKTPDYRRYLSSAGKDMNAAWAIFHRFQAHQRCA